MNRLLQGDVGSGKTVVAAAAALHALECGYQVVLMAPTELLAEQHWQNFSRWFTPLNITVSWLSGKLKGKARQQNLAVMAEDKPAIMIGTHALFQQEVQFNR